MTTWKNSGEISAKTCKKNDATSTSRKQAAVFEDRAKKPREIETPGQIGKASPRRDQEQTAVPFGLEVLLGHKLGLRGAGGLNKGFFAVRLCDQQKAASLERRDAGQGRVDKPFPICVQDAGLEPQLLGEPQHAVEPNCPAAEPVLDLSRIGGDAVQA